MRLTSFFTHKMACEYNRRVILSCIKTMNYSLTIAAKILSPNNKFVLQIRINKGLLISAKVQESHNYPHISHILIVKSEMTKVQRSGTLDSTFG